MKSRNYYDILGVSKGASDNEIRRAYRKAARMYHPDINQSPEAEAQFKKINKANEVLKDPEKRKRYDLHGENWEFGDQQGGRTASADGYHRYQDSSSDFSELFRDIFNSDSHRERDGFDFETYFQQNLRNTEVH